MKIVIEGAGEVGSHLAKMLSKEANDITIIDSDPVRLARISATSDVVTVNGAPSSLHVMREADVDQADLFIAVVPSVPQDVIPETVPEAVPETQEKTALQEEETWEDPFARMEWEEKGPIWPWWEKWPAGEVVPDHADIGDLIERKLCASGIRR